MMRMKPLRIVIGISVLAGIGLLVAREVARRRQLKRVAENGYETAHDVLYPGGSRRHKKLRYGPVLPA